MRTLIQRLRPDRFDDVVALVALYRPGPWAPTCTTSMPIERPVALR